MLSDFFRINLPYGIAKNSNGEWMAFNREYMPIGFNTNVLKRKPESDYSDLPVYTKYREITKDLLLQISDNETDLHKDKEGNVVKLFLYNDNTNPMNQAQDKIELWDKYFEKLKKLAKLNIK